MQRWARWGELVFVMSAPQPPPRYKQAIVSWLALYPVLTLLVFVLRPFVGELPLPVQTLIMTAILIPLMTWVLVPVMQRLLGSWLRAPRS